MCAAQFPSSFGLSAMELCGLGGTGATESKSSDEEVHGFGGAKKREQSMTRKRQINVLAHHLIALKAY